MICYELAQALRARGKPVPAHLFLSGCRPPGRRDPQVLRHVLPEPQFLRELSQLGGTPPEVFQNTELLELLLPVLRADFELIERHEYSHTTPLDCPITALGGLSDPEVTAEDLAQWAAATTAEFSLDMFPGDHFFIRSAQMKVMISILLTLRSSLHRLRYGSSLLA